jgi:hypothetical protein
MRWGLNLSKIPRFHSISLLTHNLHVLLVLSHARGASKPLISVEKQEFAIFLPNVLNVDFGPRREGDIHTITLSQLNGIIINTDFDCCTGRITGVVTGSLNEMGIDLIALGGVGDGNIGRDYCCEDVE